MRVGQVLERAGVIGCSVAVGDLDVTPALQRSEHHEQIGHAIAFVFVIVARLAPGRGGKGRLLAHSRTRHFHRWTHGENGADGIGHGGGNGIGLHQGPPARWN